MTKDNRTDEELNKVIAEWCGWKWEPHDSGTCLRDPSGDIVNNNYAEDWRLPNYCRDLNAVHEACKKLKDWPDTTPESEQRIFVSELNKAVFTVVTCTQNDFRVIDATARQRAEALVKVIEEGKK